MLWIDHELRNETRQLFASVASRPAGPIVLKWLPNEEHQMGAAKDLVLRFLQVFVCCVLYLGLFESFQLIFGA